jgi:hypothetical protein
MIVSLVLPASIPHQQQLSIQPHDYLDSHEVLQHSLDHLVIRHVSRSSQERLSPNGMQTLDVLEPCERSVRRCEHPGGQHGKGAGA